MLENTTNHTDVHDLGSHTVSVTHFDLDKKVKRKKKEKESYDKHYFKTKVVCFLIYLINFKAHLTMRKFINYVTQRL